LRLDVADEGIDLNAFAGRHGILLQHLKSWSGKNGDIYGTVIKTFDICETDGYEYFFYDADGLGAGVRGDARIIK
jgi:phage terminase large subunit